MAKTVTLPEHMADALKHQAKANKWSIAKQVEHWLRIGKIAEENPDLPYDFIKETLLGLEEIANGETSEYSLDDE